MTSTKTIRNLLALAERNARPDAFDLAAARSIGSSLTSHERTPVCLTVRR